MWVFAVVVVVMMTWVLITTSDIRIVPPVAGIMVLVVIKGYCSQPYSPYRQD